MMIVGGVSTGEAAEKKCPACGGELFVFEPPASIHGIDRSALPSACRRCGQLSVGSTALPLPPVFPKACGIAAEAARQAEAAREQLLHDPDARIEKYFDAVYRKGFVDGLSRAAAYFTHHAKEGRLRRLRRLWARARMTHRSGTVEIRMAESLFAEFNDLITLSAPRGDGNAEGP